MSTQIDKRLRLIATAYDHLGVLVDLYGEMDELGGVEVCDLAVTGTKASLGEWFSRKQFELMECALERNVELQGLTAVQRARDGFFA